MQLLQSQSTLDHSPIADLYQRYWLLILAYIRQQIAAREDAEDVLLEVFLAALESPTLLSLGEQQQLAWLRRVAHNKCIDHYRRASQRQHLPIEHAIETLYADEYHSPEQVTLRREDHALLQTRLSSLPALQQEVLRLRFAHGLRCAEIARLLDKSEGAIRTILSRSLNLLRGIYENNQGGNI